MCFIAHHKLRQKLVHNILLHVDAAAAQADLALVGKAVIVECGCENASATLHGLFSSTVQPPQETTKFTLPGPAVRRRLQCQRRCRR